MNAVVYLCQVSACMGVFYLFYYALLSRFTFFTINRWYLLVTMVLSFIIPLLTITVQQQEAYPAIIKQVVYVNQLQTIAEPVIITTAAESVREPLTWMDVLKVLYVLSVTALSARLIFIVARFLTKMRNKKRTSIGGVKIVRGDKTLNNGSFFNYIFLNGDELTADEMQQIIAHEMLHVKLYHSVDRLLVKVAQIFLWFNPFVYLYARAIEQNHEFEVDREVGNSTDKSKYAELLLHLSVASGGTLYHNFSMVPLKKRITMLFTKPTHKMKKVIYLLVVPVVLISCLAFAKLKSNEVINEKVKVEDSDLATADTAKIKYKQIPRKLSASEKKKAEEFIVKEKAYRASPEGQKKSVLAKSLNGKLLTATVLRSYQNDKGIVVGKLIRDNNSGEELLLTPFSGWVKQLDGKLTNGDEIEIKVMNVMHSWDVPVCVVPEYITKNGTRIFDMQENLSKVTYPFGYEGNRVRFTSGSFSSIEKYANGKWRSAVFEAPAGYKFNMTFKPDAPDLNAIKIGQEVRLRFVHEVKTGAKTYKIADWVAISSDIKDYGIKNPDFFFKFYEIAKNDTSRIGVIDGLEKLGTKPLVLIDGIEYGKEILYKLSNNCIKGLTCYLPGDGIAKYGDKAKDGAVVIKTKNNQLTYVTDTELQNRAKMQAANDGFFTRITLIKEDGGKYDMATLKLRSGTKMSADLPTDGNVGFIIDNKVYNEKDFKRLFPVDNGRYGGAGAVYTSPLQLKEKGFDVNSYNIVFVINSDASKLINKTF